MEIQQRKRKGQARGFERREALIRSARALLETTDVGDVTIPLVAQHAGVPASSAYHFYRDVRLLLVDAARVMAAEFADQAVRITTPADWKDAVRQYLKFGSAYYNAHPAFGRLIFSPTTTAAIREAACGEDPRFSSALETIIRSNFNLPAGSEISRAFFNAIQIADLLFGIAIRETGEIDEAGLDEAVLAATAYLNAYIPDRLPLLRS
jgi:AcrR family transcriptional regulator